MNILASFCLPAVLLVGVAQLHAQGCAPVATRVAIERHPVVVEQGSERADLHLVQLSGTPLDFPLQGTLPAKGDDGSAFAYRSSGTEEGCRSFSVVGSIGQDAVAGLPYTTVTLQPDASARVTFAAEGFVGEVIEDISLALFREYFDPMADNCSRFLASSFVEAGNEGAVTAELTAGVTYVLVVLPGQSADHSYSRDYTLGITAETTEPPRFYTGGSLPTGTAYTYLAVEDNAEGTIVDLSVTGNFRALPEGKYAIYGMQYAEGNLDVAERVVGSGLVEVRKLEARGEGCIDLSKNRIGGLLVVEQVAGDQVGG